MASGLDEFIQRLVDTFPDTRNQQQYTWLFHIDGFLIEVVSSSEKFGTVMTKALAHLAVDRSTYSADLRIEIYTGPRPEFFTWIQDSFGYQVQRIQTDAYMCLYNPGLEHSSPTLSFFDATTNRAIFWISDSDQIPWYEMATPFRTIFHWFFQRHGVEVVHSASIGKNEKGILLVGKGGSGKTSTALTVLQKEGLGYAGDDYVLLKMSPVPIVMSLYSTAKIENTSLKGDEKEVRFVSDTHPEKIVKQFSISAVVLPVVAHAQMTTWSKVHSAHALMALAPSTIFQLQPEDTRNDSFSTLAELVSMVPSFQLQLGTQAKEIGSQLELFLDEL